MKILVVGGGGREHAIVKKISENPKIDEIYALPGNGEIEKFANCVPIAATDIEKIGYPPSRSHDWPAASRRETRICSASGTPRASICRSSSASSSTQ